MAASSPYFNLLDSDSEQELDLESFQDAPKHVPRLKGAAVKRDHVLTQFDKYDFPEPIKVKAADIYISLEVKHLRKERVVLVQFYCIWRAHCALGYQAVPKLVGKEMGLEPSQVTQSINLYQKIKGQPTYNGYVGHTSMLAICCKKLDLATEMIDDMQSSFDKLLKKKPDFKERKTDVISVAYIWYHLNNAGYVADIAELSDVFMLKPSEVETLTKEISLADND